MNNAKLCAFIGAIGGLITSAMGGWDASLKWLIYLMAADYITGLIVAGLFHNSPKSPGGGLESGAGWKGLARKFVTLLIVMVAHGMDVLLGIEYLRDAVIIGFVANEVISLLENAGLMSLPIPQTLTDAIDILKSKGERPPD